MMEPVNAGPARSAFVPLAVSLAYLLPQFAPGSPPAEAAARLGAGALQSLSQALFLVIIIGLTAPLPEFGLHRPRLGDLLHALLLLGALLALGLAGRWLWQAGGSGLGESAPARGAPAGTALLIALFSLSVGYREELFYRAYIIRSLRSRGAGALASALLSTALFAAGHAYQGAAGMASSALLGLALALAYLKGARLHALAWAHAGYNALILYGAMGFLP
jgi:membrane protease YdiL (CAAX protease family)